MGRRRNDRCYRVRGGLEFLEFLDDDEEPLCHSMRTETEVYRFTWRSGFDGDAAVRIGRQGDQITLHWIYRWYTLRGEKRPVVPLSLAASVRLRIGTSYPGLSPIDARRGGALSLARIKGGSLKADQDVARKCAADLPSRPLFYNGLGRGARGCVVFGRLRTRPKLPKRGRESP